MQNLFSLINNIKKCDKIDSLGLIDVYKFTYEVQGFDVIGYISYPIGFDLNKKYKTIICLRGGSRNFGQIDEAKFEENSYYTCFPLNGYVTLYTQYRGNAGGTGVDEMGGEDLNDVKELFKIISQLNYCDDKKVGLVGVSRGGQIVYQVLSDPTIVCKVAISISGTTNHVRMVKENFRPDWGMHLKKMFGGSQGEMEKRSAVFWPDKIKQIPILIIHGKIDDKVNVQDSIDLHQMLPQSEVIILENKGHGLSLDNEVLEICLDWLGKKL